MADPELRLVFVASDGETKRTVKMAVRAASFSGLACLRFDGGKHTAAVAKALAEGDETALMALDQARLAATQESISI